MTIRAKVATVVSPREVAFNKGKVDGVAEGDIATVRESIPILDPDTGEEIASVSVVRLRLEVTLNMERACVGRVTDRAQRPNDSGQGLFTVSIAQATSVTKSVTTDPDLADWKTVVVAIGQDAWIDSPPPKEDEPPF